MAQVASVVLVAPSIAAEVEVVEIRAAVLPKLAPVIAVCVHEDRSSAARLQVVARADSSVAQQCIVPSQFFEAQPVARWQPGAPLNSGLAPKVQP